MVFNFTRKDLEERDVLEDFLYFHELASPENLQGVEEANHYASILAADILQNKDVDDYDRTHRMVMNMLHTIVLRTAVPHTLAYQD